MIPVNLSPTDHAASSPDAVDVSANDGRLRTTSDGNATLRQTLTLGGRNRMAKVEVGESRVTPVRSLASATTSAVRPTPTPLKRLTAGRKELAITHAGATYMLRVTKANKLILTKDADDNSTV